VPPRSPARAALAPAPQSSGGSVDDNSRAKDTTPPPPTSAAFATNPGTNILNIVNHYKCPRRSKSVSGGGVDRETRANDTTRSLSTSDASSPNPGHNALRVVDHYTPPRRTVSDTRRGRGRGSARASLRVPTVRGPGRPGNDTFNVADGPPGPSTVSSSAGDVELATRRAAHEKGSGG
jgi:hypothetical protein